MARLGLDRQHVITWLVPVHGCSVEFGSLGYSVRRVGQGGWKMCLLQRVSARLTWFIYLPISFQESYIVPGQISVPLYSGRAPPLQS
jgi:hypothetical protein